MNKTKQVLFHVALFLVTVSLLYAFLVLASAIPNEAIYSNMEKSALSYKEKEPFSFEDGEKLCGVSDNYADTILLNISWNIGKGDPVRSAIDTKYYDGQQLGESLGFYLALTDESIMPNKDYTRYPHGSAMFIRVLHLFTDVNGVKLIGFISVLFLAALCGLILVKYKHYGLCVAFVLSILFSGVLNIRLSLEYIPAFVVGFLMSFLYLVFERHGDAPMTYLSVVGGALIAFFDFLTVETVTLLLPLILVISVRTAEKRLGELNKNLILIAKCSVCWILSYVATFVSKWSLASIICGENKFVSAFESASERFSGSLDATVNVGGLLQVVLAPVANLSTLFGAAQRVELPRVVFVLLVCVMVLGSLFYLFKSENQNKNVTYLLMLLGSVVFLRYIVLNNHSYLHEFFTYRALISPIMAVFSAMILNMSFPENKKKRVKKK